MVIGDEGGPLSKLISSSELLRPLLFRTVVVFFFLLLKVTFFSGSVDLKARFRFLLLSSETAPEVFRSYPRRLDCLTICGHQGKGNAFLCRCSKTPRVVPACGERIVAWDSGINSCWYQSSCLCFVLFAEDKWWTLRYKWLTRGFYFLVSPCLRLTWTTLLVMWPGHLTPARCLQPALLMAG